MNNGQSFRHVCNTTSEVHIICSEGVKIVLRDVSIKRLEGNFGRMIQELKKSLKCNVYFPAISSFFTSLDSALSSSQQSQGAGKWS